jgi:hypothetical protein
MFLARAEGDIGEWLLLCLAKPGQRRGHGDLRHGELVALGSAWRCAAARISRASTLASAGPIPGARRLSDLGLAHFRIEGAERKHARLFG